VIRAWAKKHRAELCFTSTYAFWANPVEAHFGPLWQFTLVNSRHRSHPAQTGGLCTSTCGGATPMPAVPKCWPPSAGNVLASRARRAFSGEDTQEPKQRERTPAAKMRSTNLAGAPAWRPVQVFLWCTGRGELEGIPRRTSWTWKAARSD
jgi:hypothetical protein